MKQTAEIILTESLKLFARCGYEGVSVSMIAEAVGLSKGALYRHYESKRAILDAILKRMEAQDAEEAERCDLPQQDVKTCPQDYARAKLDDLIAFSREMFRIWTRDEFSCLFRRVLTLEQYRNGEMSRLYGMYLGAGPLEYTQNLLEGMGIEDARENALLFYGPMFMLYAVSDGERDRTRAEQMLEAHLTKMKTMLEEKINELSQE